MGEPCLDPQVGQFHALAMRILTGLQPSGKLHVGNYFGAMQPAVELQEKGEAFYFIADYHAMTSSSDAAALTSNQTLTAQPFFSVHPWTLNELFHLYATWSPRVFTS